MSTVTETPEVVRLEQVSKRFVLHTDKSLKERVLHARRQHATVDFWALRDVDLSIHTGTTVGLIGSNGSGKSTLLKVIGAIIQPTNGTVLRRGRLAALLELGAGFHPDLTGRENVFLNASILGMSRRETERAFDAIVDFSGIEKFIDNQVKFYSSGMYVRLAFAVAVHVDPDLLLVDEVLAVGDEPFQRKCMDKIRTFQHEGRTIVLVSHSAEQVGELCDRAVLLRDGRVVVDGDPAEGIRALRAGFEEQRRAQQDQAPRGEEPLLGRITGAQVLDADGNPAGLLRSGEPLRVRVGVDLHRPVGAWTLAISVETPLGHYVYGTSSARLDVPLPRTVGRHDLEFRLDGPSLGSGEYALRVRATAEDGRTIDLVAQADRFTVEAPALSTGVLSAPASLHVLD